MTPLCWLQHYVGIPSSKQTLSDEAWRARRQRIILRALDISAREIDLVSCMCRCTTGGLRREVMTALNSLLVSWNAWRVMTSRREGTCPALFGWYCRVILPWCDVSDNDIICVVNNVSVMSWNKSTFVPSGGNYCSFLQWRYMQASICRVLSVNWWHLLQPMCTILFSNSDL